MAAPKTNGVLRTKLADMKVGDYIKWYYSGFSDNVVGSFSEVSLGGDTLELPVDASINTANLGTGRTGGFFYFVKIGLGKLIADRAVQTQVSAQAMNKKNMFKGSQIRQLSYEEYISLCTDDLDGNIVVGDCFHYVLTANYRIVTDPDPVVITQELRCMPHWGNRYYVSSGNVSYTGRYAYLLSTCGGPTKTASIYFVPVMEYVDNSRSTNIYY